MKNFRKVLALILVVATLFSFTAMASAVEYTDAEKISADYTEAVEVLSAIGILNGYTDETFRPAQNIEREEMAKMIAVLSNAGDDVSELYASACTFADAKDSWAASYIAYCNQTGIIAGRSATTFDPDANVTGIETAKMLLCVLGFDAAEQGYVGSNWKTNVLRDAENLGLLNGFADDFDVSKAISREEAAQMFLNALNAHLIVGTLSSNVIKLSNATRVDVKNVALLGTTLIDAEKYGWYNLYGNVVVSVNKLYTIYPGLVLNVEDADCYENPGHSWSYSNKKGLVVETGFIADAPTYTFTEAVDLYSKVKNEVENSAKVYTLKKIAVDGVEIATASDVTDDARIKAALDSVSAQTGNGVETNVYVDDMAATIIVTVKNTYIGKVTATSLKDNSFTIDGKYVFSNTGYNFSKGDTILYWICDLNDADSNAASAATLHDAEIAEPVVAEVTRTQASGSFVADGKTYEYAEQYGNTYSGADEEPAPLNVPQNGGKYNIYLDKFGYAMLLTEYVEKTEYVYAYAVEKTWTINLPTVVTANGSNITYTADLFTADGEYLTDKLVDADTQAVMDAFWTSYKANGSNSPAGALLRFVVDDDTLVLDNGTDAKVADGGIAKVAGQNSTLDQSTGDVVKWDNSTIVTTNDYTKFMIRTYSFETGEYSYDSFVGFRNIPASIMTKIYDYNTDGVVHKSLQYFDEDNNGIAEVVFVDAAYAATADSFYVLRYVDSISDVKYFNDVMAWDVYDALVNGEPVQVYVSQNVGRLDDTTLYEGQVASLENIDGQKVYIVMEKQPIVADHGDVTAVSGHKFQVNGGAWQVLAEDAKITLVHLKADGSYDYAENLENLDKLGAYTNDQNWLVEAYAIKKGGEISELYVELSKATPVDDTTH